MVRELELELEPALEAALEAELDPWPLVSSLKRLVEMETSCVWA
jgi:hypothetical protein